MHRNHLVPPCLFTLLRLVSSIDHIFNLMLLR